MVHFFLSFARVDGLLLLLLLLIVIIAGGSDVVVVCLFDDYSVNNACDFDLYAVRGHIRSVDRGE